ncbi:MAG: autotransporter outer membrane beta-barrel domain-containing protein, partial [Lysobacteraceae bacterium]
TPGIMTPANTTALTDTGGVATASFTADQAGNFPSSMSVLYDPDGIPISGDELTVTYGFNFGTALPGSLRKPTADSGDQQTGSAGSRPALPLRVLALDGADVPQSGVNILWSVLSGDATLDASSSSSASSGIASMGLRFGAEGDVIVRAQRADIPGEFEDFSLRAIAAVRLDIVAGNGQSVAPGSIGDDMVVRLTSGGSPVSSGQIEWQVVSGDATLSAATSLTDSAGQARIGINFGSEPGNVSISAYSDDPTAGPVYFNHSIQVSGGDTVHFDIHAGDGQSGPITTAGDAPLVTQLTDSDHQPISGTSVVWETISGDAQPIEAASSTDIDGLASIGFTFGAVEGTSVIRASIHEGAIYQDFHVIAYLPQLALQSGDGQIGPVSTDLAEDFVIAIAPPATPLAKSLAGVDIQWTVIEGGGSLSAISTPTDGEGIARTRLRLGPNPGSNVVRAEIAGGPSLVFHATGIADALPSVFRIVSGNGQQLPTAEPSEPLLVEVLDGNEQPISGVMLDWSIDNGSLMEGHTSTGADGRSANIARVAVPGAANIIVSLHNSPEHNLTFSINGGVANILDLNDDQREVAEAIDTLCPALLAMESHTPEQMDLLARCLELVDNAGDHPADVVNALNEMMQDTALVQTHSALLAASTQFGNVNQRLTALRAGQQQPLSLDGLSLMNSSGVMPLALLPEAGDVEVGTDFSRWGFFANGTLGRGDSDGGGSRPQYDYDTAGLTAGVDYRFNDHWFAGVALGYTRQDNSLGNDQGSVDMSGWSISGYTTWFNASNWYVDGVLNWGDNDYDLQRRIAYDIASGTTITSVDQLAFANSGGDQLYAAVSVGRDFQSGAWNIGPYARASWARVSFDAYEESLSGGQAGSGLGLRVEARDVDAAMLVLGGKASRAISTDWGVLMPSFNLEWEHQLQDDPQHVVAYFLADPTRTPFEIGGTALDRDFFRLGIGLSALWTNGRSGFVTYEHLIGASGISQGTLSLGLRFEF